MRQVIVHPGEDQFWVAECPSLPGCISQGHTREEALENIKEAQEETASLRWVKRAFTRNVSMAVTSSCAVTIHLHNWWFLITRSWTEAHYGPYSGKPISVLMNLTGYYDGTEAEMTTHSQWFPCFITSQGV